MSTVLGILGFAALFAAFGLLAPVLAKLRQRLRTPWIMLAAMAVASMLAGNLLALRQRNVKRLLAYSSIAHFGYVLVAFLAGGAFAVEAVAVYLAGYFVTLIGAFAAVALLHEVAHPEQDELEQLPHGVAAIHPAVGRLLVAVRHSCGRSGLVAA